MTFAQEDVDALRRYIGTEYPPLMDGLPDEPVRLRDIRNYAEGTGDLNPLWLDPAYGQRFGLAGPLAPPGFVELFAPNYRSYRVWDGATNLRRAFPFDFPFDDPEHPRIILLSENLQTDRLIRPGDVVVATSTVLDLALRPSARLGRLLRVVFRRSYTDPDGRPFGTMLSTIAAFEKRLDSFGDPSSGRDPLLSAQMPADAAVWTGRLRGALRTLEAPLNLPELVQPLSMVLLVKWTASIWDMGVPHFDADYAASVYGLPAPLAHGPMMGALHRRALTDWLSPRDLVTEHHADFRATCVAGDTVRVTARLTELTATGSGKATAKIESTMTRQDGVITSVARATCALSD